MSGGAVVQKSAGIPRAPWVPQSPAGLYLGRCFYTKKNIFCLSGPAADA